MTTATVAEVLDAAATQLAHTWQRYNAWDATGWLNTVPAAVADVIAPWDTDGDPTRLRASYESGELGRATMDHLAHYLLDHVGDYACTTGDDETESMELDLVETVMAWETQDMAGQPATTREQVVAVIRAAAQDWRDRQAVRQARLMGVAA